MCVRWRTFALRAPVFALGAALRAHDRAGARSRALAAIALVALALLAAGCTTLPPGLDAPKRASSALAQPETTSLGRAFASEAARHPGQSGFELLADPGQSFALHLDVAARAERTLDVQYFIFLDDDTGELMMQALLEAADRGVRVRVLVDDGKPFDGGTAIPPLAAIAAHPNIEVRVFNPWLTRRELSWLRWAEFLVGGRRLNYRMHNKLFVADNAFAITGGRNIGDPYFRASAEHNLGDLDVAVAGPMVRALSQSFDLYWNDRMAIPVEALPTGKPRVADLERCREKLAAHKAALATSEYVMSLPREKGLEALVTGAKPLVWAKAALAYDPPDKLEVEQKGKPGTLLWERVASAVEGAQRELIIVTPYLVPGESELALIRRLRERGVRVRVLTNSLASTDMPIAHVGYARDRPRLLEMGCELFEVRPLPEKPDRGLVSASADALFGLHAKLFVVDRERAFIGSMNFDQRSFDINTEIGLVIESPRIAQQAAARFEHAVEPANSYRVAFAPERYGLVWTTEEGGKPVRFDAEPQADSGRVALVGMLSLLPLDPLL